MAGEQVAFFLFLSCFFCFLRRELERAVLTEKGRILKLLKRRLIVVGIKGGRS